MLGEDDLRLVQGRFPPVTDIVRAPPDTWWLPLRAVGANGMFMGDIWGIWDSEKTKRFYPAPWLTQSYPLGRRCSTASPSRDRARDKSETSAPKKVVVSATNMCDEGNLNTSW